MVKHKSTPKTKKNSASTGLEAPDKRLPVSTLIIGIIVVIAVIGLGLFINLKIQDSNTKKRLITAAEEIQLPSEYPRDSISYSNNHCLDDCAGAYVDFRTTSADNALACRDAIAHELVHLGYTRDEDDILGLSYSKGVGSESWPNGYIAAKIDKDTFGDTTCAVMVE